MKHKNIKIFILWFLSIVTNFFSVLIYKYTYLLNFQQNLSYNHDYSSIF